MNLNGLIQSGYYNVMECSPHGGEGDSGFAPRLSRRDFCTEDGVRIISEAHRHIAKIQPDKNITNAIIVIVGLLLNTPQISPFFVSPICIIH